MDQHNFDVAEIWNITTGENYVRISNIAADGRSLEIRMNRDQAADLALKILHTILDGTASAATTVKSSPFYGRVRELL